MARRPAARWIAVVLMLSSTPPVFAQRGRTAEDVLRERIAAQPQQLQSYVELANFYYNDGRYDQFEQTLNTALKVVRQAQTKAGGAGVPAAATGTEPRRVGPDLPPPVRLREVKPAYPPELIQKGVGGTVVLDVSIDPRGMVSDARVTQSVEGLDDLALAAVRQWEFAPSFVNDAIVPLVMPVRLTFVPETIVRMAQSPRRQVPLVLGAALRYFQQGAYGRAEVLVTTVLLAGQRERSEPVVMGAAMTTGVTTSDWPIRGGRDLRVPAKTRDVGVLYPPEALQAGTAGIVSLDFVIDEQGKPANVRSLGIGLPAFVLAAREAVQQWEYAPTTIAGKPVPVAMSVTFAFQPERGLVEEVVRVGGSGEITEPRKIKHVPPRYPPEAQRDRTQGVIVMEAIISREGKVGSVRILRSAGPALDKAALEAVRQWEFTPTRLYGIPVAVLMTVTVTFSLG